MKVTTKTSSGSVIGKVEVHPSKPSVRVTIKPEKEGDTPKVYVIEKENCPDYVQNGVFYVNVNADGSKLYSMRPQAGVFKFKVKEFVAQKDKEPTPKTIVSDKGSFQVFSVLFEITEGQFKGMVVPGSFSYHFQETKEEVEGHGLQSVVEISHPKSKFTPKLIELLEVSGIINQQLPWKENLLPLLQKRMLQEAREFSGSVKEGYIDSLYTEVSEQDFG